MLVTEKEVDEGIHGNLAETEFVLRSPQKSYSCGSSLSFVEAKGSFQTFKNVVA